MSILWKGAEVCTALQACRGRTKAVGRGPGSEEGGGLLVTFCGACHVASTAGQPHADSLSRGAMASRGLEAGDGQGEGEGLRAAGPRMVQGGSTAGRSRAALRSPDSGSGAGQDTAASAAAGPREQRGPWAWGPQAALQSGAGADPTYVHTPACPLALKAEPADPPIP
ncbi:unnamed protein product [Rangifer tarandus platyrhynchus]|uniref:Uncharacterized protein n=2 Tax=Rangifer tarandus platyrhynchus TaxID=3082113 RepID=A0ABN8YAN8_RANTA|nr:unnamed protein product [Rangifer tarandus platyrhynchus]CAI9696054.1 unnamed protein product [Rangifer tarandus platyrhynchus]